jgi:hypothetical protein
MVLNPKNSQAGVTLLLSILVLAAMAAISFSIATIVFAEIRAAGDVSRTEPALYAAQANIEEAIYNIKRSAGMSSYTPVINSVSLVQTTSQYQTPGLIDRVLASYQSYGGASNVTQDVYYLINPVTPYVDSNADGSWDGGYSKIILTNTGTAALEVGICYIEPTWDCVNQGTGTFSVNPSGKGFGPDSMSPGLARSYTLNPLSSYIVYVVNKSLGVADSYIKLDLKDNQVPAQPIGLPYFNKKSVDVTATYTGLTRKYRAVIPTY